jgi:hypothetical protein
MRIFLLVFSMALPTLAWAQMGRVDAVTRASPSFAEQGAQINLWIVGRDFVPGAQVTFSQPGLEPALVNDLPLPVTVFPNPASEGGMDDGIQYFLRVAGGEEAPQGLVDITVTNPDGSSAVGRSLLEIVRPGTLPMPEPGEDNVDGITGASPVAANIGRNVSLWLWGTGFRTGARVEFSSPDIREYARAEVVEVSQSHPGFSGIRVFVIVTADAMPGPVDVTVVNPNSSRATAPGILQLVEAGEGAPGGPGRPGPIGECPDLNTSIVGIDAVEPAVIVRGTSVEIAIHGQAFACGASVIIPGGGLSTTTQPILEPDPDNPFNTTLRWELEISPGAALGPRNVTVINPNNTHKELTAAFEIAAYQPGRDARCSAIPGQENRKSALPVLMMILMLGLLRRGLRT